MRYFEKMKYFKKIFVLSLVSILVSGSIVNAACIGRMVKISKNTSMYYKTQGDGKATVVFISGYGDGIMTLSEDGGIETWSKVISGLPENTTKVTFDPLGLGNSNDVINRVALTDEQIAAYLNFESVPYDFASLYNNNDVIGKTSYDRMTQLYLMIKRAVNINGPVILVAHSLGMFTAYEFALKYPNMVKGIVSVDGTFPTSVKVVSKFLEGIPEVREMYLGQFTNESGSLNEVILSSIKVEQSQQVVNGIPLIIVHDISGENGTELQAASDLGVEFWLDKFPSEYSKSINVDSGHYVMSSRPDVVISAINEMLKLIYPNFY